MEVFTEAIDNTNVQISAVFCAAEDFLVHFHNDLIEEWFFGGILTIAIISEKLLYSFPGGYFPGYIPSKMILQSWLLLKIKYFC